MSPHETGQQVAFLNYDALSGRGDDSKKTGLDYAVTFRVRSFAEQWKAIPRYLESDKHKYESSRIDSGDLVWCPSRD